MAVASAGAALLLAGNHPYGDSLAALAGETPGFPRSFESGGKPGMQRFCLAAAGVSLEYVAGSAGVYRTAVFFAGADTPGADIAVPCGFGPAADHAQRRAADFCLRRQHGSSVAATRLAREKNIPGLHSDAVAYPAGDRILPDLWRATCPGCQQCCQHRSLALECLAGGTPFMPGDAGAPGIPAVLVHPAPPGPRLEPGRKRWRNCRWRVSPGLAVIGSSSVCILAVLLLSLGRQVPFPRNFLLFFPVFTLATALLLREHLGARRFPFWKAVLGILSFAWLSEYCCQQLMLRELRTAAVRPHIFSIYLCGYERQPDYCNGWRKGHFSPRRHVALAATTNVHSLLSGIGRVASAETALTASMMRSSGAPAAAAKKSSLRARH